MELTIEKIRVWVAGGVQPADLANLSGNATMAQARSLARLVCIEAARTENFQHVAAIMKALGY